MNPIVHGELGWLTAIPLSQRRDRLLVTAAGVLPDLDGLTILVSEDAYARWHHLLTHGALAAGVTAVLVAAAAKERLKAALLALVAFHLHLLGDLAGSGPGWPIYYLGPFSEVGVAWKGGWELASWQNSSIGLAATIACLACALPLGRTVVEVFSTRADSAVVKTLRARFSRPRRT